MSGEIMTGWFFFIGHPLKDMSEYWRLNWLINTDKTPNIKRKWQMQLVVGVVVLEKGLNIYTYCYKNLLFNHFMDMSVQGYGWIG